MSFRTLKLNDKIKSHRIQIEIKRLQGELDAHQTKCKHKQATKVNKGNTGNFDPSDDCYWNECFCPTCLKFWHEDQ